MSQMLNSIKNAAMAKRSHIEMFHSKECEAVAKVLKDRGFLTEAKAFKNKDSSIKYLALDLAYVGDTPVVTDVKRVSKPGHRVYRAADELHKIRSGLGVAIVSTSRGIMPSEEAKKKNLGGEVICEVR